MTARYTGGCQCGAVRYLAMACPANPHLCFCRMCQKSVGNYFVALGSVADEALSLTRGEACWFHSSDLVKRGFCQNCGTPLFYKDVTSDHIAIVLGSLDNPEAVPPEWQSDTYGKTTWFSALDTLPESIGDESADEQAERYRAISNTNHQHPDHDTESWPPRNAS